MGKYGALDFLLAECAIFTWTIVSGSMSYGPPSGSPQGDYAKFYSPSRLPPKRQLHRPSMETRKFDDLEVRGKIAQIRPEGKSRET